MYIYLVGNHSYMSDMEAEEILCNERGDIIKVAFPEGAKVTTY